MAGAKLLIVDDEPDILLATRSYLTRSFPSLQVETAAGGAEAVARLAQERFDIILSDYRMPGMDGLELLAAASRIAPAAARLLFTAYADTAVAVRAVNEAHIVHFFTKPLDPALLHEVLAAIVAVQAELALQRAATARPHALWQTDPGPPVGAG